MSGLAGASVGLIRFNNDGSLDNTFANNRYLQTRLLSFLTNPVIIQSDGKIIVAGTALSGISFDYAIARYNADGSVDSSFSENGLQLTKLSNELDVITSLAIFNDKLYAAGSADYYFNARGAIATYTSTGEPDSTFGSGGVVQTGFGSNRGSTGYAATAIQTDGKIVTVGNTGNGSTTDFALARYNIDGRLDNTFSDDGKQTTSFGSGQLSMATSVALQNNGKIVVIGRTGESNADENFATVRYNTDGSLDSTFNIDGRQTINFGDQYVEATSVAIQKNGKIVVVGSTGVGTSFTYFALVRYNSDGSVDSTFDQDGKLTTDVSGKYSYGASVVIQNAQKIVVSGGTGLDGFEPRFLLVRYNEDGSLDKSFSGNGIQSAEPGYSRGGSSLALQPNGKLIMAGFAKTGIGSDDFFTVARYNSNGSVDSSFDKDGRKLAFKSSSFGEAVSVALQLNGKIIAGGYISGYYEAFASFNSGGSFNTDFSGDGMLIPNNSTPNSGPLAGIAISKNTLYSVGFYYKQFWKSVKVFTGWEN